jgi:hypothetical protein
MKKLTAIPAYLWAIVCLLIIPVCFIKNDTFANEMAKLPFMKLHPVYSGGDQAKIITDPELVTTIYKPVFESLFGKSKTGFVQLKFSSPSDTLPLIIKRDIDYNSDNAVDFGIEINTQTGDTKLTPVNTLVRNINISSKVKKNWVVRVNVTNPVKSK